MVLRFSARALMILTTRARPQVISIFLTELSGRRRFWFDLVRLLQHERAKETESNGVSGRQP